MTTPLVFFSLEFNRIADDRYDALMAENADLARYKPVLRPDARDEALPAVGRAGTLPA
jgi:oligoendopeptidase F